MPYLTTNPGAMLGKAHFEFATRRVTALRSSEIARTISAENRMGISRMQVSFCPNAIAWGDIAAWFGGLMTLAAVVTALGIALRDGRRQQRERHDRGRLVAAYLYQPFSEIAVILEVVAENAERFGAVLPGEASINVHESVATIHVSCGRLSELLQTFRLADAAFLPRPLGEDLARTAMMVTLLTKSLGIFSEQYLAADESDRPDAERFEAGHGDPMSPRLARMAVSRCGRFLNHCRGLFGEVISG
jgi:hypothetical protein